MTEEAPEALIHAAKDLFSQIRRPYGRCVVYACPNQGRCYLLGVLIIGAVCYDHAIQVCEPGSITELANGAYGIGRLRSGNDQLDGWLLVQGIGMKAATVLMQPGTWDLSSFPLEQPVQVLFHDDEPRADDRLPNRRRRWWRR